MPCGKKEENPFVVGIWEGPTGNYGESQENTAGNGSVTKKEYRSNMKFENGSGVRRAHVKHEETKAGGMATEGWVRGRQ